MHFKTYNGTEEEKEKEIYFALEEQPNQSGISLEIVDREGQHLSRVLTIDADGLYLHFNILKNTNLPLDKSHRIKLFAGKGY